MSEINWTYAEPPWRDPPEPPPYEFVRYVIDTDGIEWALVRDEDGELWLAAIGE